MSTLVMSSVLAETVSLAETITHDSVWDIVTQPRVIRHDGGCYFCQQDKPCCFHHNYEGLDGCLGNTFYLSWGDYAYYEDLIQEDRMTEADREAEAARREKEEEEARLAAEARIMATYAQERAMKARCKDQKGVKHHKPCKNLFYDETVPKSLWKKDERGKVCAPLRRGLTGSQCWGWVYTDPKTGQKKEVFSCQWMHPDEDGWHQEWNTDRTFNPDAPIVEGRFAALASSKYRQAPPKQEDGWETVGKGCGGGGSGDKCYKKRY